MRAGVVLMVNGELLMVNYGRVFACSGARELAAKRLLGCELLIVNGPGVFWRFL
jgi:hypothetical protein